MRILLTTDTIGGVWTFTQELATELLGRGHAVALLSLGREPSSSQTESCERLRASYGAQFGYVASSAPLEWMEGNDWAYSEGSMALLALAERFQPDLVHSSQFCFGALPLPVPVVITAHSDVLSWATACQPEGLEPSAWLARYRALIERGLRCAKVVVAPTQWMSNTLAVLYDLASAPEVIFNGRSVASRRMGVRRMQAVSVGRFWDEAKNLALLAEVRSAMPILVAGERSFEGSEVAAETGNLTLLGSFAEQELLELFRESSLYIAPSRYEPFGLAPLEAAQCGCALLLNDLPSFREIWGEAALYFQDTASLEDLLATLSQGAILAAQGRALARARELTGRLMAEQYERLYRKQLSDASLHQKELVAHAC